MNASIYFWTRDVLFSKNPLFNKKTGIYIMPKQRSFDIDSMIDFVIVKNLLNEK
jgi:CMP-N,N'-diacetyllegionaminic acid synthase